MASPLHPYGDYGTALQNLRGARNTLGYILFFCVLIQIVGFFLMRFTTQPYIGGQVVAGQMAAGASKASQTGRVQPGVAVELPESDGFDLAPQGAGPVENFSGSKWLKQASVGRKLNLREEWAATYYMLAPVTQLLGLLAAASQAIIIFVCLLVVLVAQAPGVSHLSRSLIWSVILIFLVLPLPGHGISFARRAIIVARYVLWPVVGLVVMLVTAERFRAGTRLAIGHPLQSMMLGPSAGPPVAAVSVGARAGVPSGPGGSTPAIRPGVKI